MAKQNDVVWLVIRRLIEMREELHRTRERQNAEMRAAIDAITRPRLHGCGGRGCHSYAAGYASSNTAAK